MGRGGAGVGQFPALWMQVVVGGGALKWCERMMLCRNVCVMCVVACSLGWFLSTEGMQWIAGTYQDNQSIVPSPHTLLPGRPLLPAASQCERTMLGHNAHACISMCNTYRGLLLEADA
jgi:hypothetical protein